MAITFRDKTKAETRTRQDKEGQNHTRLDSVNALCDSYLTVDIVPVITITITSRIADSARYLPV
jgi:hypothetical protein